MTAFAVSLDQRSNITIGLYKGEHVCRPQFTRLQWSYMYQSRARLVSTNCRCNCGHFALLLPLTHFSSASRCDCGSWTFASRQAPCLSYNFFHWPTHPGSNLPMLQRTVHVKTKRLIKAHVSNIFFQNKIFVLRGEKQGRFVNKKQVLLRLWSFFRTVCLVMDFKRALLALRCSNRQLQTHRWHLVTSILVSSLQVRQDRHIYKNPNLFYVLVPSSG